MEWNHLPMAGGLYEQHPKLLDDFEIIMHIDSQVQDKKNKKREGAKTQGRSASRRRGR